MFAFLVCKIHRKLLAEKNDSSFVGQLSRAITGINFRFIPCLVIENPPPPKKSDLAWSQPKMSKGLTVIRISTACKVVWIQGKNRRRKCNLTIFVWLISTVQLHRYRGNNCKIHQIKPTFKLLTSFSFGSAHIKFHLIT